MKKITLMALIALTTVTLVTGCGKDNEKDKEKLPQANTNEDVIKDQTVESFSFENTSLVYYEGTTTLETVVTNTMDTDQTLQEFQIIVKDKDDNVMITLVGFVGSTIKAGESKVISSNCGEDLTKAASIEYVVVR